jgi:murein DD-endopeptidase MepM/ murein hydrolase activator NlpD
MPMSHHKALREPNAPEPVLPARIRTHALGKRPQRVSGSRQGRTLGLGLKLLLVLLLAWSAAATWFAWSGRSKVARLEEEQVELRQSYQEKEKALIRRLVGVASHGILEQEGLSGRLAEIIARQVELENRQSALMLLGDRVANVSASGTAPPASVRDDAAGASGRPRAIPGESASRSDSQPRAAPAEAPTLRLGAPGSREPAPTGLGPRSSLEERVRPKTPGGPGTGLDGVQALPLREQFGALEASIGRLETAQIRHLGSLSASAQSGISLIRASLATLGLAMQAEPGGQTSQRGLRPSARTAALNPFEAKLASVEAELGLFDRWRSLLDAVPVRPPVEGYGNLTSNFGPRKDPFTGATAVHAGIDFRGTIGTPIKAAAAGRVITADVTGGYGNLVEVEHSSGVVTRYAHLSAFNVSPGQTVTPGTVVGLLGSTGRSTGPHLHYETRMNGSAVDPMRFLQAGAQVFNHPPLVELAPGSPDEAAFD